MKAARRPSQYLLSVLCLLTAIPSGMAQVYAYKDAEGHTVFTDQPRPGAKPLALTPSNRISAPAAPLRRAAKPAPRVALAHYQMLRILLPLPDAGVQQESGALIVTVTSDPALMEGHYYRLLLDDNTVGDPSRSPVFSLQNVDRGEHSLAVEIIDDRGHVVERTPPQPFAMQRISLAQKRRMRPCETDDYGVRPECPLASKPAKD